MELLAGVDAATVVHLMTSSSAPAHLLLVDHFLAAQLLRHPGSCSSSAPCWLKRKSNTHIPLKENKDAGGSHSIKAAAATVEVAVAAAVINR